MRGLEEGRLAPGQRLVETSLAAEYRVGRNAVREAVQWLAAQGIVDITRHRSASLRRLDAAETRDMLEIAEAVIGLLAKAAAGNYQARAHEKPLSAAIREAGQAADSGSFARARRHFYATLLAIGNNNALRRLFPASGLPILFGQYPGAMPRHQGQDEFRALAIAIVGRDIDYAHALGRAHIGRMRKTILSLSES